MSASNKHELIEKNEKLIYGFLKKYNLDVEDYYGLAAIGLVKAARDFDESRGTLATVAYKYMFNEVMHYKRTKKNNFNSTLESLDELKEKYNDYISDTSYRSKEANVEEAVMVATDLLSILDKLNIRELAILDLRLNGLKTADIRKKLGVTHTTIYNTLTKIKDIYETGRISSKKATEIKKTWEETLKDRERLTESIRQQLAEISDTDLDLRLSSSRKVRHNTDSSSEKQDIKVEAKTKVKPSEGASTNKVKSKVEKQKRAIFVASLDPITLKHLDIIQKAITLFDKLIILVQQTPGETDDNFNIRLRLIKKECSIFGRVVVVHYNNSAETYARTNDIEYIVRSYELGDTGELEDTTQFNGNNADILAFSQDCTNIYIPCDLEYIRFDSYKVRELAKNGDDISTCVTKGVEAYLKKLYKH